MVNDKPKFKKYKRMPTVISLSIRKEVASGLYSICREENLSFKQVCREALEFYAMFYRQMKLENEAEIRFFSNL